MNVWKYDRECLWGYPHKKPISFASVIASDKEKCVQVNNLFLISYVYEMMIFIDIFGLLIAIKYRYPSLVD